MFRKTWAGHARCERHELSVGTALPDTVELLDVPDAQYRCVVVDRQTVLVDPARS